MLPSLRAFVVGFLGVVTAESVWAAGSPSHDSLVVAQRRLKEFDNSKQLRRYRHHWLRVISGFGEVSSHFSGAMDAAEALYLEAGLWLRLYEVSHRDSDMHRALAAYEQISLTYAKSPRAPEALWQRATVLSKQGDKKNASLEIAALLQRYPESPYTEGARRLARHLPAATPAPLREAGGTDAKLFGRRERGPPPRMVAIKHWSNKVYTRVALYLSGPAEARLGELPEDRAGNPARIFVDIAGAVLGSDVRSEVPVNDDLLEKIRVAQREDGKVRVVFDLKKTARPRFLVMENPFRLVVDAMVGDNLDDSDPASMPLPKLARRRRVVIDPGHGGYDSGAVGPGHVLEKDVVLAIAKRVQRILDATGIEALMTRSDDTFVSLEERTAIANRLGADAFVSVHANSAPNKQARGIETYYLNVTDDRYAIRLAAVENKTSEEQVSDLQLILADLSTKANSQESVGLAARVQKKLVAYAHPQNPEARNLGVKASLFYVLLGARMPAILVETSFLSNAQEARLLASEAYQHRLARAIAEAVTEHLSAPVRMVGQ